MEMGTWMETKISIYREMIWEESQHLNILIQARARAHMPIESVLGTGALILANLVQQLNDLTHDSARL